MKLPPTEIFFPPKLQQWLWNGTRSLFGHSSALPTLPNCWISSWHVSAGLLRALLIHSQPLDGDSRAPDGQFGVSHWAPCAFSGMFSIRRICRRLPQRQLIMEWSFCRKGLHIGSQKTYCRKCLQQKKCVAIFLCDWSLKVSTVLLSRNRCLKASTYLTCLLQVFFQMGWITFLELPVPLHWL